MTEIVTERLLLRGLRDSDAQALVEAANNFEVARWLAVLPHPYTLNDAKNFIVKSNKKPVTSFGIFHCNKFVGGIGTEGQTGLGFWLAQDAWGNGFASEAVKAVLGRHFNETDADEISSGSVSYTHLTLPTIYSV